jgi:hypothetical protein
MNASPSLLGRPAHPLTGLREPLSDHMAGTAWLVATVVVAGVERWGRRSRAWWREKIEVAR